MKQRRNFPRQANDAVKRRACARLPRRFQHLLHVVVHKRNLRCNADANRHARVSQRANSAQAAMRRSGARLQLARQPGVKRGDGHVHGGQPVGRHGGNQIQVVLDTAGFGDQRKRVACLLQHLDHAARQPQLALYGLVAIGGRTDVEQLGHVAALGQISPQHFGNIALGNDFGFKVQPGRQVQVAV